MSTATGAPGRTGDDARRRRDSGRRDAGVLVLLVLLATALRLPGLGDSGFADELSTYAIVVGRSPGEIVRTLAGNSVDLNPPLAFLLARATEQLGPPFASLRVVPFLAGLAVLPATYLLGRWTVGRGAGLLAAAVMATSPFLAYYATEARQYSLIALLSVLTSLGLLWAVRTDRKRAWAAYALLTVACLYTAFSLVFVLAAQAAWAAVVLTSVRRRGKLVLANAAALVAFLPWLPVLRENLDSPGAGAIAFLIPLTPEAVLDQLVAATTGHPYLPPGVVPGRTALVLLLVGAAAAVVGATAAWVRRSRPRPGAAAILVLTLALATPVGILVHAQVSDSIWNARNLVASWPGFAVVAGAVLAAGGSRWRLVTVTLVLGGLVVGTARTTRPALSRPDTEAAASAVRRLADERPVVVDDPNFTPGPYASFGDAALRRLGRPDEDRRFTVLRLGRAPLADELAAPPYLIPPAPSPARVAATARRRADGRPVVLVAPTSRPLRELRAAGDRRGGPAPGDPYLAFARALAPAYRASSARSFAGFVPTSVYVFRAEGSGSLRSRNGSSSR